MGGNTTNITATNRDERHGLCKCTNRLTRHNQPPERHCRNHHDTETECMVRKIRLGKFHPDREQAGGKGDAHDLERYGVDVPTP